MNVSNRHKYVIHTRGPLRLAPGFATLFMWPTVGLLLWCALMWLGFTLAPLVRGCWA